MMEDRMVRVLELLEENRGGGAPLNTGAGPAAAAAAASLQEVTQQLQGMQQRMGIEQPPPAGGPEDEPPPERHAPVHPPVSRVAQPLLGAQRRRPSADAPTDDPLSPRTLANALGRLANRNTGRSDRRSSVEATPRGSMVTPRSSRQGAGLLHQAGAAAVNTPASVSSRTRGPQVQAGLPTSRSSPRGSEREVRFEGDRQPDADRAASSRRRNVVAEPPRASWTEEF